MLVSELFKQFLKGDESALTRIGHTLYDLSNYEQRSVLFSVIRCLSKRLIDCDARLLGGAGAGIARLLEGSHVLQDHIEAWLVDPAPEAVLCTHAAHRVVVLALTAYIGEVHSENWE